MQVETIKLIYFSPTGGTEKILYAIARGVGSGEIDALDLTNPKVRRNCRFIMEEGMAIIGVPVYAEKIPYFLKDCLKKIEGNGKPAILVSVYGNIGKGIALNQLQDFCSKSGFIIVGAASFIGEHSFSNDDIPVAKGRPDSSDLELAERFGKDICEKLSRYSSLSGFDHLSRPDRLSKFDNPSRQDKPSKFDSVPKQDKLYRAGCLPSPAVVCPKGSLSLAARILPLNAERLVTRQPRADAVVCRKCGICIRACPMGAIHPETLQIDEKSCIRCFACVKNCPSGSRKRVFKKRWVIVTYLKKKGRIRKEPVIYI